MVQTNVGSSTDEVKIEEAMFLLFGQDCRRASHEPSRGFRGKGAPRWNGRKGQSAYVATEDATGETDFEYDLDEIYEAEENEAYDYMTPMLLMHHGSRNSSTGRMNLGRMLHTKQTEDAAQDEEYEVKRLQPTWMLEEDLLIWPVMAVPPTSSGVSTSPPPSYSFSNGKRQKGKVANDLSLRRSEGHRGPLRQLCACGGQPGHYSNACPNPSSKSTTPRRSQSPVRRQRQLNRLSTWSTPMLILAILEHYVEPWTIEPAVS